MGLRTSKPTILSGVVSLEELAACLRRFGQDEWCTNVRLLGLLMLIHFLRQKLTSEGASIPADLAHQYISPIKRPNLSITICEPLAVLCKLGILKCVSPAINGHHMKKPAAYAFENKYCKRHLTLPVILTAKLASKLESALPRRDERLNKRYPYRKALRSDLDRLSFASESRRLIAELLSDPDFEPSTQRDLQAVDGGQHWLKVSVTGQITTSISGCPRELKKRLLIDGQSVVFCDISYAHHCFLPRFLTDRIEYLKRKHGSEADVSDYEIELTLLIQCLSEGDYYGRWCRDPEDEEERKQRKVLVNMLLNSRNSKCEGNRLYRYMRQCFPITFGICEDVKAKNHCNISKPLQHWTAEAINGALLEAQTLGIPAIPDVDAIICPKQYSETVSRLIGKQVYNISGGVRCKVNDIRYEPLEPASSTATNPTRSDATPAAGAPENRHDSAAAPLTAELKDSRVHLAQPSQEFDVEAQRIALELTKLYRAGAIKGLEDALYFARLLRDSGASNRLDGLIPELVQLPNQPSGAHSLATDCCLYSEMKGERKTSIESCGERRES